MCSLAVRSSRAVLRGDLKRLFQRSLSTTSMNLFKKSETSTDKGGYSARTGEIRKKEFEEIRSEMDSTSGYAFISFMSCVLVYFLYMSFKTENDSDIKSNLRLLKLDEKMCIKAIAHILQTGTHQDTLFYQKKLVDIQKEIKENEDKLEGLE
ncbi:uncharacterized protein LOC133204396 [Saccostrea echinata]|uniref:uncharacterized protein LOC133204396 n=1 Tax=Saccostrea echinata TaxID=191078 RepID=UPI002A7EDAD1|nr:uncharacterized protein LOC133204396 [Saccostrea echinata]